MVSVKSLTTAEKQMELKDMNACSRDTVPVVTIPVSLTMHPLRRFSARARRAGSNEGTTGMSWMKVRLSQSRGQMSCGLSSVRRVMTDQSTGSGLAGFRQTVVQACQRVEFDGVGVFAQVVLAGDGPEDLGRGLMRLIDGDAQLFGQFEIDAHVSCS